MTVRATTRVGLIAAAALLALSGCASTGAGTAPSPSASPSEDAATEMKAPEGVTFTDAWIKAAPEGMSAVFGEFKNTSGTDVNLTAAGIAQATQVELHETVDNGSGQMIMRPKEGGFVIPAGGTFELKPGGNHIMIMGLTKPLAAGDTVSVILAFANGTVLTQDVPVKDYAGANENYETDAPTPGTGH
ncbi:copper chaperone PCu(A)C [Mycetocola saprophilus]|uniref:copper chaperone PCu(A)C n=1 Tax=Mycetocola saprophilus TaxID=76636 RepID=UPI003BF0F52F